MIPHGQNHGWHVRQNVRRAMTKHEARATLIALAGRAASKMDGTYIPVTLSHREIVAIATLLLDDQFIPRKEAA